MKDCQNNKSKNILKLKNTSGIVQSNTISITVKTLTIVDLTLVVIKDLLLTMTKIIT